MGSGSSLATEYVPGLYVLQETLLEEEKREGRLDILDVLKQKSGTFESLS